MYLSATGKTRNASDADISVIFSVTSCVLSFWFKASLLEYDVHPARQTRGCLRAVVSKEIWRWAAQF